MSKIREFYLDMFASHFQLLKKRGVYDASFDVILNLSLMLTLNISSLILFICYLLCIEWTNISKVMSLGVFFIIYLIVFLSIYLPYRNMDNANQLAILKRKPKYKSYFYFYTK